MWQSTRTDNSVRMRARSGRDTRIGSSPGFEQRPSTTSHYGLGGIRNTRDRSSQHGISVHCTGGREKASARDSDIAPFEGCHKIPNKIESFLFEYPS